MTSLALTASLGALCPVPPHYEFAIHEHEHVPHHDFTDYRPVIVFGVSSSSSSSSSGPMTWQNGSMFDAAAIAIRARHATRVARTHCGLDIDGLAHCHDLDHRMIGSLSGGSAR